MLGIKQTYRELRLQMLLGDAMNFLHIVQYHVSIRHLHAQVTELEAVNELGVLNDTEGTTSSKCNERGQDGSAQHTWRLST